MIRIVIVRPKIWNVIVIGILPPPLRGEPKPPIACWSPWGHKTIFILPKTAHFVNSRRRTSPPRSARHLPLTRGGFSTPAPKAPLVKGRLFHARTQGSPCQGEAFPRPHPRLPLSRGAGAQRLRGYPAAAGKGSPSRGRFPLSGMRINSRNRKKMTKGARREIVRCEQTDRTLLRDLPSQ